MLQQRFTHRDVNFPIFTSPDWGEMGDLKVQIIFTGSPHCSPDSQDTLIWLVLFYNIVPLLWGQNLHNISSPHAHANWMFDFIRMQLVYFLYRSFMDHLFMFWDFPDTTEVLYCFSVFILLHSICLYPHLPHLVEEEAFLLLLTNVHLCGFSICSWCFLPTTPEPLNSAGSWLYNPNTVAWRLYVERLWAESAFLQLIGQSETLLFHSLSYSALI